MRCTSRSASKPPGVTVLLQSFGSLPPAAAGPADKAALLWLRLCRLCRAELYRRYFTCHSPPASKVLPIANRRLARSVKSGVMPPQSKVFSSMGRAKRGFDVLISAAAQRAVLLTAVLGRTSWAHLGTAPAGPRTVPVRRAWPGKKSLAFCSPPQRAAVLRTGTVRGPGEESRCARVAPPADKRFDLRQTGRIITKPTSLWPNLWCSAKG